MNSLILSFHKSRAWFFQDPYKVIRPLLVIGVLLLSIMLPFAASFIGSTRVLLAPIALIAGLVVTLVFWRQPALGLILVMLGGFVVPFSGPSGINVAALGIAFLLVLWIMDMMVFQRKIRLIASRPIRPLLLFLLIATLSFIIGQLPWFYFVSPAPMQAQIGGLLIFVFAAAAFLLAAHQIKELRWLQWMTWLFIIYAGVHISGWIIPGVGPLTNRLYPNGTTNNGMFWVWLVAIAFSQALINNKLHLYWRVALGVLTGATLFVGFFWNGGWKSGYLPAMVAVAAIIGLRYQWLGLFMALLGYIPAWYLSTQAVASDEYSFGTRVDALNIMLKLSAKNPLLGLGPANYYWYVPIYRIRGYYSVFSSHNQYLDLLVETGILGIGCIFWFAGEVGLLGWRLRNRVPEGFAQAYVYGALGGLVGTLAAGVLADWVLPFVYNIGFTGFRTSVLPWLFLGGLVSLEQMYKQPATSPDTD